MAVTRIKNNQITDATIDANVKLVDYSLTSTKIANNLTYGSSLTVSGNLTVNGTTTTIDTVNVSIQDPILLLADNQTGSPSLDIGFIGKRGNSTNIAFVWKESAGQFETIYTSSEVTNTTVTVSSFADLKTNNFTANGNASIASNLFVALTSEFQGNVVGNVTNFTGNIVAGNISTPGNVTGGNLTTAGIANIGTLAVTGNGTVAGTLGVTGNATAGNVTTVGTANIGTLAVTGNGTVAGTLGVTGNANVGNLGTAGLIVATGNITGGNVTTAGTANIGTLAVTGNSNVAGTLGVTGNATVGNLTTAGTANVGTLIVTGNSNISGNFNASGNITGNNLISINGIYGNGLNITGDAVITGNLAVQGNLSYIDIEDLRVQDPIIQLGGGANGNALVANDGYDRGTLLTYYTTAQGNAFMGWDNSSGNMIIASNVGIANEVISINSYGTLQGGTLYFNSAEITGNANVGNLGTAGLIVATGNITGGNLTTTGIANIGTLAVTGNGTVVGTLGVTGNANVGNLGTAGLIVATGNITGGNVTTAGIANIATLAVTGNGTVVGTLGVTGNITGGNVTTAGIANIGTLEVTGNGTVVGTLGVTGNITGGNITTAGQANIGNIRISGDNITDTNGRVNFNSALGDVDFAVNGGAANVFYVDAGANTASFGNATQTANALVAFNSATSIVMPVGNTLQRPGTGVTGMMRFNTSSNSLEYYDNAKWTSAGTTFTVIVSDQFSGNGVATAFTLSEDSTTAGTIVAINGVVQIPTTAYSVTGNVLTFTEAPLSTDYIDARILTTTTTVKALQNATGSAVVEAVDGQSTISITGNVLPTANSTYSLGNASSWWSSLYVAGNTIYLGNLQLKAVNGQMAFYAADGTTPATVAASSVDTTTIANGTSAVAVVTSGGNIRANVSGATVQTISSGGANVTGYVNATGNVTGGNLITGGLASVTGNVTGGNLITGGLASVTGNITGGNLTTTGIGNIGTLAVTGNANVGNLGTGGSMVATGNVTGGNLTTGGLIVATGNVTGANLTTAGVLSVTGNANVGNLGATNVVATNLTGTLQTGSQTNITSVGTLGSLTVSGNITPGGIAMSTGNATIGNLYVSGTTTIAGNITQVSGNSGSFFGNASTGFNALYAGLPAGFTLLPQSVVNFVSQFDGYSQINNQNQSAGNTATADYVLTSNNGNDSTYYLDIGIASSTYNGVVAVLDNAMGNSVTPNDAYLYTTGNVAAGNPSDLVLGAVDIGGQIRFAVAGSMMANVAMKLNAPNTTSSNTTTGTAVITGGVGISGALNVGGAIGTNSIINTGSNATGNIGSSTTYFNTVFAKATSAQYADLAEYYESDATYEPGTVVMFGGSKEVTIAGTGASSVAGVISTNPSYIMNSGLEAEYTAIVALTGRVPTKVVGTVRKGDMMISAGDGRACACTSPQIGTVIGKALADFDGAEGVIEVVVGRL